MSIERYQLNKGIEISQILELFSMKTLHYFFYSSFLSGKKKKKVQFHHQSKHW